MIILIHVEISLKDAYWQLKFNSFVFEILLVELFSSFFLLTSINILIENHFIIVVVGTRDFIKSSRDIGGITCTFSILNYTNFEFKWLKQ